MKSTTIISITIDAESNYSNFYVGDPTCCVRMKTDSAIVIQTGIENKNQNKRIQKIHIAGKTGVRKLPPSFQSTTEEEHTDQNHATPSNTNPPGQMKKKKTQAF
jgi:hypothetical protein